VLIEKTGLPGVLIITPQRFSDARGFFCESWNDELMKANGLDIEFVQDNHSMSFKTGTVRGLHFQAPPRAQTKLVRCGRGRFLDVAVDVRNGSPTYGKWASVELSFENGKQFLVPEGFLHGFVTREPDTEINYKCSDFYSRECDGAVRFDDADIGIDWGIDAGSAHVSQKDANAQSFSDFKSPFVYHL